LNIGGKTNIPGVLLAGQVGTSGGFTSIWGAKQHSTNNANKNSTGQYMVYH